MAKPLDWHALLVDGYEPLKKAQQVFRRLPREPRCKLCQNPFAGIGGKLTGLVGRKPSRKNPNLCQYCFDHLPSGGIELDVGVVFADVRGSTAMGEQASATEFAARLNEFYAVATGVLVHHDGLVDKLIGDEVMALFLPGLAGPDYRRKSALAALDVAKALRDLPVGVGAYAGIAFVGNVGAGSIVDFTALGDAVNVGARLQSLAAPGEVVLGAELYELVETGAPGGRAERVDVRGRDEPVDVKIVAV
jgi:adenylate cyclase